MASHFLIYRRIIDRHPASCSTDADDAKRQAAALGGTATVTRMLTGSCVLCGRGVSKLNGDTIHTTVGDDA